MGRPNLGRKICDWCKIKPVKRYGSDFCSRSCSMFSQRELDYKNYIFRWLNHEELGHRGIQTSLFVRRYLTELYNNSCHKCGWNEINKTTNKVPLEIEHKDGNYENCNPENLDLLCPNCHSLTPTYRALNKGNGRAFRRKNYTLV